MSEASMEKNQTGSRSGGDGGTGGGGPVSQYTLFPAKKKRGGGGGGQGRSKRSPEKLPVNLLPLTGGRSGYRVMSRRSGDPDPCPVNNYPALGGGQGPPSAALKSKSFAEMVKAPSTDPTTRTFKDSLENSRDKKSFGKKGKKVNNESIVKEDRLAINNPNQISAFTYNKIGRSDDNTKYVMSKLQIDENLGRKTIPTAMRSDIEVEFRDSDADTDDDDFMVEFSASAKVNNVKKIPVNKISALTFQQIGKTSSDHETYVMNTTRSWSAVVGKKINNMAQRKSKGSETQEEGECESKSRELSVHDKIKAKMKEGIDLTPEEREILRQKRRDRRKREKEKKKQDKEVKARQEMLKPQTTKLNIITGDVLNMVKHDNAKAKVVNKASGKGIKFMDEEYPDLGARLKKMKNVNEVISTEITDEAGRIVHSDRESNSEWETEDDLKELESEFDQLEIHDNVEVVNETSGPISYSSILKSASTKKTAPTPGLLKINPPVDTLKKDTQGPSSEKKKVKKNDPIMFDINSALVVKSKEKKKNMSVVTGKLKKESSNAKSVRNQLDGTAPSRKRGKEREGGKKKRKSVMKKIIIAERERKRAEAEKRREERIKQGIKLQPLPIKDDFDTENNAKNDLEIIEDAALESQSNYIPDAESKIVQDSMDKSTREKAIEAIHSRKFRSYCDHLLSPEVNSTISVLMSDLIRFQDKQYAKDPTKARAKRRYVVGLREVAKFLKVKKIKALILAPDIEKVETQGGLDDAIGNLISDANNSEVPVIFGLNRFKLGKLCLKKVPISCIGILNYQGSDVSKEKIII